MSTLVHLELQIDPAHLADFPRVLNETLVATRAWPGNEGLQAVVDDAGPTRVVVVEHWASTADHAAYDAWRKTPEGASGLGAVLAAAPVKRIFSEQIPLDL